MELCWSRCGANPITSVSRKVHWKFPLGLAFTGVQDVGADGMSIRAANADGIVGTRNIYFAKDWLGHCDIQNTIRVQHRHP